MSAVAPLVRQHLIDPEVCIRCNTCEEHCPAGAIGHDARNYAIRFERCDGCNACIPPCPTGAIDSYRRVSSAQVYAFDEQLGWDSLPAEQAPSADPIDAAVEIIPQLAAVETATSAAPPWSAAHPYVGLYTPARPAVATVSGNFRLTADEASADIHHLVLDFGRTAFPLLEGQSIGILPPGVDAAGRPHHVRLYSVASPRDGERPGYNNVALTVRRVASDHDGQAVHGVCSNHLCDLARGDTVQVVGPFGSSYLMPNHPGASLLMICTGTGAAPMRAMTERRRRRRGRGEDGRNLLFFGARAPGELPYFGPLTKLPADFIEVHLAFSRVPDAPRRYVQDLIREQHARVFAALCDPECYIYLCGLAGMERGVDAAFAEVCRQHDADWPALLASLRAANRYHVETY
ncbi:MAG: benzoyl-CoA 2,3-epoxidase subunit BoxA [Gammaproteobacteria bacterium]